MGAPKRTTRIPARGATLAAADALLGVAADHRTAYDLATVEWQNLPRFAYKRRRNLGRARERHLIGFMQAITQAQDLANGKHRDLDEATGQGRR